MGDSICGRWAAIAIRIGELVELRCEVACAEEAPLLVARAGDGFGVEQGQHGADAASTRRRRVARDPTSSRRDRRGRGRDGPRPRATRPDAPWAWHGMAPWGAARATRRRGGRRETGRGVCGECISLSRQKLKCHRSTHASSTHSHGLTNTKSARTTCVRRQLGRPGQSSALVSAPPNKTYQPTPRPDQPSLPPPLARPVLHPPSKSPRGRRAPLQCSRRARPPLYLKMGAQSLEVFTDMSSAMMRPYIPSAEAVPWIRTWGEQRTNAASARPRPGKGDGSWGAWGGGRGVRAPCPRTAW